MNKETTRELKPDEIIKPNDWFNWASPEAWTRIDPLCIWVGLTVKDLCDKLHSEETNIFRRDI